MPTWSAARRKIGVKPFTPYRQPSIVGEDQPVRAGPVSLKVECQSIGHHPGQRDHPVRCGAFRWSESWLTLRWRDELAVNRDHPPQEVHSVHRHPDRFGETKPAPGPQHDQGSISVRHDVGQFGHLLDGERYDLSPWLLGELHIETRSRGDDPVTDRRLEHRRRQPMTPSTVDGASLPANIFTRTSRSDGLTAARGIEPSAGYKWTLRSDSTRAAVDSRHNCRDRQSSA